MNEKTNENQTEAKPEGANAPELLPAVSGMLTALKWNIIEFIEIYFINFGQYRIHYEITVNGYWWYDSEGRWITEKWRAKNNVTCSSHRLFRYDKNGAFNEFDILTKDGKQARLNTRKRSPLPWIKYWFFIHEYYSVDQENYAVNLR